MPIHADSALISGVDCQEVELGRGVGVEDSKVRVVDLGFGSCLSGS